MSHKIINKKTSKHRTISNISNFFDKYIRKIKTTLKAHHAPTRTTTVTATVSNQKRTPEES